MANSDRLPESTLLPDGILRVSSVIGVGGFSITYLAESADDGRRYAVKELFTPTMGCRRAQGSPMVEVDVDRAEQFDSLKEKFLDEARLLTTLSHPGIVKVHHVFFGNGTCYMVMDYIEGCTLQRFVQNNGARSFAETANYLCQVAEALEHMHAKGVIHRDISPDNIMITPDRRAVIIDFGTARRYSEHTECHTVMVKERYSPLEQHTAIGRKGPASDVYSLGAVAFFTLTGKAPADCHTLHYMAQQGKTPVAPADLVPGLEPYASRAVVRAMNVDPALRQQTATEFVEDFTGGNEAEPPRRRRVHRAMLITCALLALVAGVAAYLAISTARERRAVHDAGLAYTQALDSAETLLAAHRRQMAREDIFPAEGSHTEKLFCLFDSTESALATRREIQRLLERADSIAAPYRLTDHAPLFPPVRYEALADSLLASDLRHIGVLETGREITLQWLAGGTGTRELRSDTARYNTYIRTWQALSDSVEAALSPQSRK